MGESEINGFFILVVLNFIAGIFSVLSGDYVLGLLFTILMVVIIILYLVKDILDILKDKSNRDII